MHLARAQHRSIWVRYQKWGFHFGPLGPEKRPSGKNRIDGCDGTEILLVLPLGIVRIDEKTANIHYIFMIHNALLWQWQRHLFKI